MSVKNLLIRKATEDGRYSVLVEKNGSLKFTCVGYEDKTVMGHRTKRILRIERKEYQTY